MSQQSATHVNTDLAKQFLLDLLSKELSDEQSGWLFETYQNLEKEQDSASFHLSFGAVSRFLPRESLSNVQAYEPKADEILAGWSPYLWNKDCMARVLLLSAAHLDMETKAHNFLWDMFDTADMWEQVAIFSALPTLPFPEAYVKIAAEGLRTNMAPVFDAVALDNPYPALFFTEDAWNQMYLKAAFMQRPLYKIQRVSERSNQNLSRMILDYVHERWAAGREVSPEIWQPCTLFLTSDHLEALNKLSQHKDEKNRAVVELIRTENPDAGLQELEISLTQEWTWEKIGQQLLSQSQ